MFLEDRFVKSTKVLVLVSLTVDSTDIRLPERILVRNANRGTG